MTKSAVLTTPHTPLIAETIVLGQLSLRNKIILDFGCGDGAFTRKLHKKGRTIYGCDIDSLQIKKAKQRSKHISYRLILPGKKTPYKNNMFDTITLMGVLEHVESEEVLLRELYRILKPDGELFIYVLNKGLTGLFDSANIKFRFPSLHKFLYSLFYSKRAYDQEFVSKKETGMIGDFTLGKSWHSHYSKNDLIKLLGKKFRISNIRYYSLFLPILLVVEFVYARIFKRTNSFLSELINFDQKIDVGKMSYSLVAKCIKV